MPDTQQGPWTKYQQQDQSPPPTADGPWKKYQQTTTDDSQPAPQPNMLQRGALRASELGTHIADMGKGVVKEGVGLANAMNTASTFGLNKVIAPEANEEMHRMAEPSNTDQAIGKGAAQVAEMAVDIPGVAALRAAQGAKLGTKVLMGATRGAIDVGTRSFANSGGDTGQGLFGAFLGGAFGAVAPLIGKGLQKLAQQQYWKILKPTTKAAQEATEKVLEKTDSTTILDKGWQVAAATRKQLAKKFADQVEQTATNLNKGFNALNPAQKAQLRPVINDFMQWLDKKTRESTTGAFKTENAEKLWKQGYDIVQHLMSRPFLDTLQQASPKAVREFRQSLQDEVFHLGGLGETKSSPNIELRNKLRGLISDQLHKDFPSLKQLDADFSLMKTAQTLYEKSRLPSKAAEIAASGAGGAIGAEEGYRHGGWGGSVVGAILGGATSHYAAKQLEEVFASTAWRSVSAVAKNKVGTALVEGNTNLAARLAARAVGWSILRTTANDDGKKSDSKEKPKPQTDDPNKPNPFGFEFQ